MTNISAHFGTGKLLFVGDEYTKDKFSIFVKDHQTGQSGYVRALSNWELTDDITYSSTWYMDNWPDSDNIANPLDALNYCSTRWHTAEFTIVYLSTHVKVEKHYTLKEATDLCRHAKIKEEMAKLQEELRLLERELSSEEQRSKIEATQ